MQAAPEIKYVGEEFERWSRVWPSARAHVGMAASNTFLFLTDVLPRRSRSTRDRFRSVAQGPHSIPTSRGRHDACFASVRGRGSADGPARTTAPPVIIQYVDDKSYVVWPRASAARSRAGRCRPARPIATPQVDGPDTAACLLSKGWSSVSGGFTAVSTYRSSRSG